MRLRRSAVWRDLLPVWAVLFALCVHAGKGMYSRPGQVTSRLSVRDCSGLTTSVTLFGGANHHLRLLCLSHPASQELRMGVGMRADGDDAVKGMMMLAG